MIRRPQVIASSFYGLKPLLMRQSGAESFGLCRQKPPAERPCHSHLGNPESGQGGEDGVELRLVEAGDVEDFAGLGVAVHELDLGGLEAKGVGEELDDGLVGLAAFGGGGHLDFDAVGVAAGNACAGGAGDDLNGEHGHGGIIEETMNDERRGGWRLLTGRVGAG